MTTVCTLLILAHLEVLPAFQHRERLQAMPAMLCASQSQVIAAQWADEHQGWVISKVECGYER